MKYANNTLIGRIINNDESSDKEKISSLASTAINQEAIGGAEQFSCSWESAFQNNRHGHHISTPVIKGKSHRWLYLRKTWAVVSWKHYTLAWITQAAHLCRRRPEQLRTLLAQIDGASMTSVRCLVRRLKNCKRKSSSSHSLVTLLPYHRATEQLFSPQAGELVSPLCTLHH